jgi:hypothetical protein
VYARTILSLLKTVVSFMLSLFELFLKRVLFVFEKLKNASCPSCLLVVCNLVYSLDIIRHPKTQGCGVDSKRFETFLGCILGL